MGGLGKCGRSLGSILARAPRPIPSLLIWANILTLNATIQASRASIVPTHFTVSLNVHNKAI